MKKIVTVIFTLFCFSAMAQQTNTLLDQSFWQDAPNVAAVKAEIAKGNNPLQSNFMSMDPVVLAINAQAPTATIKFLLDQPGMDPNKPTHDARTYLHWAANRGNDEVMEYLISKGAKVNVEDSHGTTPLTFAASSGQQNTKVYDIFLAHGVNLKKEVTAEGANVLLLAIANDKDLKLTDYFIGKGLDIKSTDAAGNNAFSYAAKGGNIELLKTLVQKGVPVNQNAILMAAQGGGGRRGGAGGGNPNNGGAPAGSGLAIYQYLESAGVKPTTISKTGQNVLHYVVRKQNQGEVINYFLGKGVDINQADEDGNTVLMNAAAGSRDTVVLNLLLAKTKNINQANKQGLTALTLAVRGNTPAVTSLFISKGADVKVVDSKGNNLAYYLIESFGAGGERQFNGPKPEDFDAKLKLLQDKGLSVTAPQKNGNTLYHLAVAKNNLSLLQRLQPLGINVNAKNNEGLTPLLKAAMISKNDAMLKYLISIGAKKDSATEFKETAYDLAKENESLTKNNVSIDFLK